MVSSPDYKTLLLKQGNEVIGINVLFIPANEDFFLVEYMAIHSKYRNRGLGRQLFLHGFQLVQAERQDVYCLLEVDSDRETCSDRETRRRRQRFYRRLGCLRIDGLPYILPLHEGGQPPQMDIMVCLPDGSHSISRNQLENWLRVIYDKVYDCSPDDPRIGSMMVAIDDPVKLV